MSESNPVLAMLLAHNSFIGAAEMVEETIQPLDEQLAFGPGDAGILATANTPLEQEFTVVRAVDPEQHADTYPDWEERVLGLGKGGPHVLCEIFSRSDTEISLGWVSRLKILPIKAYRYKELRSWRKKGFPDDVPAWVMKTYVKYTDQLSDRAPDVVPKGVVCPQCHQRNIELLVVRRITYHGRAGLLRNGERDIYVPVEELQEDSTHVARLRCQDCDATADLEDEEWSLPELTN